MGVQGLKEGRNMKILLIATTALTLFASPASAQLLGGGGALGGTLGGGLGGRLGNPMNSIGSTTNGTLEGTATTSGSHKVDRRSGTVHADRSASGTIGGTIDSTTDLPRRTLSGKASGNASGSAGSGADAQLIGTDAVRSASSSLVGSARNTASGLRDRVGQNAAMVPNPASIANGTNGSTDGSANGNGAGSFSGALGQLALAGTSAANGAGSFDVAPGMAVINRSGHAIGTVRSVATDAKGHVKSVLVGVGARTASIPAANFTGSGSALISAMGKGELKNAAKDQTAAPQEPTDSK
jgi:hypothetical protein